MIMTPSNNWRGLTFGFLGSIILLFVTTVLGFVWARFDAQDRRLDAIAEFERLATQTNAVQNARLDDLERRINTIEQGHLKDRL